MENSKIKYIGVNDHKIDLFEGQYIVPNGMAYNSYVICDEKIAVMDTVDVNFKDEWLENLKKKLVKSHLIILLFSIWSLTILQTFTNLQSFTQML